MCRTEVPQTRPKRLRVIGDKAQSRLKPAETGTPTGAVQLVQEPERERPEREREQERPEQEQEREREQEREQERPEQERERPVQERPEQEPVW